jgi:DNA repair protein RadC
MSAMTAPTSPTTKGSGHRRRLRDRFLQSGLAGFHDYEVIELLLTLGTPRKDCKDAAKAALKRFKTFQAVLEASPQALCEVPGIGPLNQMGIRLIKAVADRYLHKQIVAKDPIGNSKAFFDYLYHTLRDKARERFVVCYLDARNRILDCQTLFVGTLTASAVYPREVVRAALDHHAVAVIVAHNHPSGDPQPSADDMAITRRLVFACGVMDIRVHEHLIVGDNRYFSFADQGIMARLEREFENRPEKN